MTTVGGIFMQKVLVTFGSSWLIVVIRDLPEALRPRRQTKTHTHMQCHEHLLCTFCQCQLKQVNSEVSVTLKEVTV